MAADRPPCAFAKSKTLEKGEETHEQDSRLRTYRARARAGAADRTGGRRNRTDPAPDPRAGLGPDREQALPGAIAAEHRRRRGTARGLHADAGRGGTRRRPDGAVPRAVR